MREFIVDVWKDADLWAAHCKDLPIATEAKTLNKLFERAHLIAGEIALLNGLISSGETLKLKFIFEQESVVAA